MLMISGPVLLGYALILSLALAVLNKNGVGGSLTAVVALGLCVLVPAILAPGIRRQPMGIHNVRLWVLWAVVPTAAGCAARNLDQSAARKVDHSRGVHSTCFETTTLRLTPSCSS